MKRALIIFFAFAAAGAALCLALPGIAERRFNRIVPGKGVPVSEAALRFHETLSIVDLHADSLLWGRDLLRRSHRGHLDLPRLVEGGVAIQVFSVVTSSARAGGGAASGRHDLVGALAVADRWPPETWRNLYARALYQAARMREMVDWEGATCGRDVAAAARSIRRAIDLAGVDHVALGSDFDGAVAMPFDASQLPQLTAALLREGLSPSAIRAVAGENALRVFSRVLP